MKFWQSVSYPETEQLPEIAKLVEETGFEGILVSDHLFLPEKLESRYPYSPDGAPGFEGDTEWPEPWSVISAMAAVTERLRFATMVYILPLRDPFTAAKAAATASVLSGGRVALGIGVGWMKEEFDAIGAAFTGRGRRTDEMMSVLRTLWRGGMVEHHGEFYDFDRLQMSPAPSQPIPVWVGGASPRALRRAGALGDGWLGSGNALDEIPGILAQIGAARREAGRDSEPFEAMAPLTDPPAPDTYKRLEDAGGTSTVSYPFPFALGPRSTLDQKRAHLEGYAEAVIRKVNE